jgi:hypothetical protein
MVSEVLERAVGHRIIPAGGGDRTLVGIRRQGGWHALKVFQGMLAGGDPMAQFLAGTGFGIGILAGSQNADKKFNLGLDARLWIGDAEWDLTRPVEVG